VIPSSRRLLVVGASGSSHIGGSFFRAGEKLGHEVRFCDVKEAWRHGSIAQKILWRCFGRRPLRLTTFGEKVVNECVVFKPDVRCANFSTDDPFNPAHRAPWFLSALREYDLVATPRRANIADLKQHGCLRAEYVPFGYDSDLFFPPAEPADERMASDLFFAGTADRGRVPFIVAALEAGLNVRLHGIYWERFPETRGPSLGQADIPTLRRAIQACRVALCVVRHENRDGHAMRSFEIPAVGACMAVEDTAEHREIYGTSVESVQYFRSPREMAERARWLLSHPNDRHRMNAACRRRIVEGRNTYADRLQDLIKDLMHE